VVYKGYWRGGEVAIKKLLFGENISPSNQGQELANFLAETEIMVNLRPHSNVVQMIGFTTTPDMCIVAEFLTGGSLEDYLASSATIDTNSLIKLVNGICAGMLHLHSEGIVHRDLAARNILLAPGFTAKISDFGLSRAYDSNQEQNQTRSKTGPLRWMAPEALTSQLYSNKTDAWAFGVTLIEIVTRQKPFPNATPMEVAQYVCSGNTMAVPPNSPAILHQIMTLCFAFEPQNRPEFSQLQEILTNAPPSAWNSSSPQKKEEMINISFMISDQNRISYSNSIA